MTASQGGTLDFQVVWGIEALMRTWIMGDYKIKVDDISAAKIT